MLKFSVLSSGSKANCTYVTDGTTHLMVDCGLSAREATKRLASLGVKAENINAILITHEHSDHMSGVGVFASRYGSQVYGNGLTLEAGSGYFEKKNVDTVQFEQAAPFDIGGITVEAFSVPHDAADPVGFKFSVEGISLVVATDLGKITSTVRNYVRDAHALVLESNHDHELLFEAPYPWELKQRIKSSKGHLSNEAAALLINELSDAEDCCLQVVVAAHVSEKSNMYDLALDNIRNSWKGANAVPKFYVADVAGPTALIEVEANRGKVREEPKQIISMDELLVANN